MSRLVDMIIEDNSELVKLIVNFSKLNDYEINKENRFKIINLDELKKFISSLDQNCTTYLKSLVTSIQFPIQIMKTNKSGKKCIEYKLLGMESNMNHILLLDYYKDSQFAMFVESLKRNCSRAILSTVLNVKDNVLFTAIKERQLIDLKTTNDQNIVKEILLSKLNGCVISKGYKVNKHDESVLKDILVNQEDLRLAHYNFGGGFIVTYMNDNEPETIYWHVEKECKNGQSFCISLSDNRKTNLSKVKKFIELDSI